MRQHYEARFAQEDPYLCGRPENKIALVLGFAKIDLVARLVGQWDVQRSVDVGCGDWGIFHQVSHLVGSDIAVAGDLSLRAVQKARRNSKVASQTQFVVFDAERLPFCSNVFDTVYCSEVVEHTVDARRSMDELARLATHHVMLTIPNEELTGKLDSEHLQTFGHDSFCKMVEGAGLRIKNSYGLFLCIRQLPSNKLPCWPLGMVIIKILLKLGEWMPRRSFQILMIAEGCPEQEVCG